MDHQSEMHVEFKLPEDLQKRLENIADDLTSLIYDAYVALYQNDEFSADNFSELTNVLLYATSGVMERAADKFLKEKG